MIELRKSAERGYADHGWLRSFHSFSFAEYRDPAHMHFGPLRVINEDFIEPNQGFGTHAHRDMEIITYVLSGDLSHKDSMGNGSTIRPGNVQRMSAGRGVTHSEFNHGSGLPTHLLQIWIIPDRNGLEPGYEERHFSEAEKRGRLRLVVSGDGVDGSVSMHQDARLYVGLFDGDERATLSLAAGRRAYVHLAKGALTVNGQRIEAGDAIKLAQETDLQLSHGEQAEVLVFDLP